MRLRWPAGRSIPIDSWTNRLTSSAASYDAAGSLTWWGFTRFEYDTLGMLRERQDPAGTEWLHLYAADDERLKSQLGNACFDELDRLDDDDEEEDDEEDDGNAGDNHRSDGATGWDEGAGGATCQ